MATFGGRETDRAFLSLELRVHRCKTVKVMVTKKESLDELSRKFESKKIFLSQFGNELGKVLKGGDQSTKESRNSAKLMNSYLYSYPDMLNCFENLFTRCAQDVKEDGGKFSGSCGRLEQEKIRFDRCILYGIRLDADNHAP